MSSDESALAPFEAFQEEVRRLTGVQQQRLRFGFPKSKVLKDQEASLKEVGLQDGELLILEDLHDLFLGNLAPGQPGHRKKRALKSFEMLRRA